MLISEGLSIAVTLLVAALSLIVGPRLKARNRRSLFAVLAFLAAAFLVVPIWQALTRKPEAPSIEVAITQSLEAFVPLSAVMYRPGTFPKALHVIGGRSRIFLIFRNSGNAAALSVGWSVDVLPQSVRVSIPVAAKARYIPGNHVDSNPLGPMIWLTHEKTQNLYPYPIDLEIPRGITQVELTISASGPNLALFQKRAQFTIDR